MTQAFPYSAPWTDVTPAMSADTQERIVAEALYTLKKLVRQEAMASDRDGSSEYEVILVPLQQLYECGVFAAFCFFLLFDFHMMLQVVIVRDGIIIIVMLS